MWWVGNAYLLQVQSARARYERRRHGGSAVVLGKKSVSLVYGQTVYL
jgi:hypothetical protein